MMFCQGSARSRILWRRSRGLVPAVDLAAGARGRGLGLVGRARYERVDSEGEVWNALGSTETWFVGFFSSSSCQCDSLLRRSETTPEGSYSPEGFRVTALVGSGCAFGVSRGGRHSASCSTGGRLPIELCSRRVFNHATHSTIASSSLRVGAPHAIADQLGLERIHERFGQRVEAPMSRAIAARG